MTLGQNVLNKKEYKMREIASLVVQIIGLITVAFVAYKLKNIKKSLFWSIIIMFFINIIAQILIAGGGEGAIAGFVLLPIYGAVVASIVHSFSIKKE